MKCKFFVINMLSFSAKMSLSEISIVRFKTDRLLLYTMFWPDIASRICDTAGAGHDGRGPKRLSNHGMMKIVFEKLAPPSGISARKFLRTGGDRAGSIKVAATRCWSGAKRVEIKVGG